MSRRSKVIVIIAAYNGGQYWSELMPGLTAEYYPDFDVEILVVDNDSSDDTVAYLQEHFSSVKLIVNQKNLGFVGANNIGYQYARQAKADYIYLLNQDTVIRPGWLQPLYDFARQHKFGSLQSKLLLWPDTSRINTVGNVIHFLGFGYGAGSGQPDRPDLEIKKINYASGAGVFLSMRVLADLAHTALFDETLFMYLEDLDLGWSLNLLGYDHYLVPDSIVYHKYSFDRSMKNYYWFERNRLWIMLKNYRLGTLALIFPAWLLMEIGQWIYAIRHRRLIQKFRAGLWFWSLASWRTLLRKRLQIQSKRVRTDRQVVGAFSSRILFQGLASPLLALANIFLYIYWAIVKRLIFW